MAAGDAFLGDNGDVRCESGKALENDGLGGFIGVGDRGGIGLGSDLGAAVLA